MRLKTTVLTLTVVAVMSAEAPQGWYNAGSQRDAYDTGIDTAGVHGGKGSGYIKSTAGVEPGRFGTMMQNIKADQYRGKNLRLSAFMKTSAAEQGAWVWLRIDDIESGWSDNMMTGWSKARRSGSVMRLYFRFQPPLWASLSGLLSPERVRHGLMM